MHYVMDTFCQVADMRENCKVQTLPSPWRWLEESSQKISFFLAHSYKIKKKPSKINVKYLQNNDNICFNANITHTSCTSGKPIFLFLTQTHVPAQLKERPRRASTKCSSAESCTFRYSKMQSGLHVYKHLRKASEYLGIHINVLVWSSQYFLVKTQAP